MFSRAAFAAALLAYAVVYVEGIDFTTDLKSSADTVATTVTQPSTSIRNVVTTTKKSTTAPTTSTSTTTTASTTSTTASTTASSKDPEKWTMPPVISLQARVVSDPPVWDATNQRYTGSFGSTVEEKYVGAFDTVNTASIEGALLYVQAEGINKPEQSIPCQRKNNMRYIIFYQMIQAQPPAAIAWYDKHVEPMLPPEYCPYVAMDGGKCTMEGDRLPVACQQYNGQGGQPKLGMCIGTGIKAADPRAPYPDAYWFSYPNSCPFTGWKEKKTPACRQEVPGGLCPQGTAPDGKTCSYAYDILGYLSIDALVGITTASDANGTTYSSFNEFCQAGKIEFQAINDGARGFTNVTSDLTFWTQPGDATANRNRTEYMIQLYNSNITTGSSMRPLMSVETLTKKNPPCYKTTVQCAKATNGCRRVLYSQLCQVCETMGEGCVKAPQGFEFPALEIPKSEVSVSNSSTSGSSSSSFSVEDGSSSIESPEGNGSQGGKSDGKKKKASKPKGSSATNVIQSSIAIGLMTFVMAMAF